MRRRGAVQPLVERLQAAYADIWQLKLLLGLDKLKVGTSAAMLTACLQMLTCSSVATGQHDCY